MRTQNGNVWICTTIQYDSLADAGVSITCGHAQVCLVMELDLRGPGQVHIGLGVTPGEHGEGEASEAGAGVTREAEQQHEAGLPGLLQHHDLKQRLVIVKFVSPCSLSRPADMRRLINSNIRGDG